MKFQYSPGLIGYGAKGADGSTGLQGLAIYFTDFNPLADIIPIRNAIENNEVLWSAAAPGTKLPGGRKYVVDDLIIDSRGFVYRITVPALGDYINTEMALNKSTFFTASPWLNQTLNGFDRYFNNNDSQKIIIDNVFTVIAGINYSLSPSKIYGISPKNFARIEYSNISDVSYNAFSLYSSGQNVITDDHKSLAIVKKARSNEFHIGNLDSNNLFRDVDLILDVSSLRFARESGNQFNKNTTIGTVLTNSEKNANPLFSDFFIPLPSSFIGSAAPTHVTLNWNLADFTSGNYDPSITGILYFYKKEDASGTYTLDASVFRPLAFHNLGNTGSLIVSILTLGQTYEYYLSICKNGWERNSLIKQITTANTPALFTIVNPSPPTLTASSNGVFIPSSQSKYPTTITTDSFTGWNMTDVPMPNWITTRVTGSPDPGTPFTGAPNSGTFSFDISISAFNGYLPRTGTISFVSEAPTKTITITQNRRAPISHNVSMTTYINSTTDAKGRVNISPALDPGQTVTLNTRLRVRAHANGSVSHNDINIYSAIDLFKNGIKVTDCSAFCHSSGGNNYTHSEMTISIPGIVNGDIIEIRQQRMECLHYTSGLDAYGQSAGYLELISALDGYDSFSIVTGQQYWNVTKYYGDGCIFTSRVDSAPESWVDGPDS